MSRFTYSFPKKSGCSQHERLAHVHDDDEHSGLCLSNLHARSWKFLRGLTNGRGHRRLLSASPACVTTLYFFTWVLGIELRPPWSTLLPGLSPPACGIQWCIHWLTLAASFETSIVERNERSWLALWTDSGDMTDLATETSSPHMPVG